MNDGLLRRLRSIRDAAGPFAPSREDASEAVAEAITEIVEQSGLVIQGVRAVETLTQMIADLEQRIEAHTAAINDLTADIASRRSRYAPNRIDPQARLHKWVEHTITRDTGFVTQVPDESTCIVLYLRRTLDSGTDRSYTVANDRIELIPPPQEMWGFKLRDRVQITQQPAFGMFTVVGFQLGIETGGNTTQRIEHRVMLLADNPDILGGNYASPGGLTLISRGDRQEVQVETPITETIRRRSLRIS
jgi:hypothetical protein